MARFSSRFKARVRAAALWLGVAATIWSLQLAWLYVRLGRPTWSEYWRMRSLYRPGIQAVGATGGEYLPGYVFHPLSPTGAKWAFILAAGVYAVCATAVIWTVWRATQRRRQRAIRSFRRVMA